MVNLFDNISDNNKSKLLKILAGDTLNIGKDINVFSTMNMNNTIGIITKGYFQVIKNDYNGNKTLVEELYEDDIFGGMMYYSSSNEYDVIAKEESQIITIEYSRIIDTAFTQYSYYNQFIQNLLQILADEILKKNERIEILTKKTIRNKLLQYFNNVSRKNGSKNIYLPFSYTEFADYLAIDRSAMTRELGYMKEEGLIVTKGRKIILKY